MSNFMYVCCCGSYDNCGCHFTFGGQLNYTATWTGSITAGATNCACQYAVAPGPTGGAPATYADVTTPETWNASVLTLSWGSFIPGTANFCSLGASTSKSPIDYTEYEFFNNTCTATTNTGSIAVNQSIIVLPPDPSVGRTWWEADCHITGLLRVRFKNITLSCTPNNANWTLDAIIAAPAGGCENWNGIADWSYNAGTFSIV
jgi:hypothetical protein